MIYYPAQLPPIVDGASLEDERGWVGVMKPYARQNIVKNPSAETGTTGYAAAGGGAISRTTNISRVGAYSMQMAATTTGDGVYYDDTTPFVINTNYAVGVWFRADPGQVYELSVRTTAGVSLRADQFIASGYWDRIWIPYREATGANRRVYVTKVGGSVATTFWLDGLQIEPCGSEGVFPTTYIDGDQQGMLPNQAPPAYGWAGTPHASTSYRIAQTRAGGRIIDFREYGFTLSGLIGLGLTPPQLDLLPFSVLDGSQYRDARKPDRAFSLIGRFDGASLPDLLRNRGQLSRLFDRDVTGIRQPLTLVIQPSRCGVPIAEQAQIHAVYTGGLDGNHTNDFAQQAGIQFLTTPNATLIGPDDGIALDGLDSLAQDLWARSPTGDWAFLGGATAFTDGIGTKTILSMAQTPDGYLYIGGGFNNGGQVASADSIVRFRDGAYSIVGGAANSTVRGLAVHPNGNLILTGDFTTLNGGGTAANRVATWNGATYSALGTGLNGNGFCAVADALGNIYVGGQFTLAGGVANTVRIAKWDGSVWTPLSTGADNTVWDLAIGLDGTTLYAAGQFTAIGGVTVNGIGVWNGSVWDDLAGGVSGGAADVFAIGIAPNGTLYAGGDFTAAGGVSALNIASWNGVQWSALGAGVNDDVNTLAIDPTTGLVYVGGAFGTADGLTTPTFAKWNGSSWSRADVLLGTTWPTTALYFKPDGTLILGGTITAPPQSLSTSGLTTIVNNGTAETYPRIVFTGVGAAAAIIYLSNTTTGAVIEFNLTIQTGEVIVLTTTPDNISLVSSTRGNLVSAILAGSNTSSFSLQPGANIISLLIASSSHTAIMSWSERYLSFDDLVPVLP